ncbi:MAG: tRNA1(Val) (adenine(37)-N6)-methyltransferase [Kiloniellaceae bacterium]
MTCAAPWDSPDGRSTNDPALSADALLNGQVRLLQPATGYRAAIDPVFLAAAVPARAGEGVLDLGCGVGAAGLCLLARVPGARLTGLDIQRDLVDLARENARLNGWSERLTAVCGDVSGPPEALAGHDFHHVMCNPPYVPRAAARPSANRAKAVANVEGEADLGCWVSRALAMARPKGTVTFIHRADRLDGLLAALNRQAGEITVFPLWPARGKAAKRVIVRARKGALVPSRLCAGLVLHEADGRFTPAAEAVLRGAAAIEF